jgi:hypothetical protein
MKNLWSCKIRFQRFWFHTQMELNLGLTEFGSGSSEKKLVFQVLFFPKNSSSSLLFWKTEPGSGCWKTNNLVLVSILIPKIRPNCSWLLTKKNWNFWPAKPYLCPTLVGFDDYTEWQDYVQALLSIKTWSNCFVFFIPAWVNCFVFFFLHMGWTFCLSKCPKSSWGKTMLGKVPPNYTEKKISAGLWVFWNQHNNSEAQKSRVMPQEQGVPGISVHPWSYRPLFQECPTPRGDLTDRNTYRK